MNFFPPYRIFLLLMLLLLLLSLFEDNKWTRDWVEEGNEKDLHNSKLLFQRFWFIYKCIENKYNKIIIMMREFQFKWIQQFHHLYLLQNYLEQRLPYILYANDSIYWMDEWAFGYFKSNNHPPQNSCESR